MSGVNSRSSIHQGVSEEKKQKAISVAPEQVAYANLLLYGAWSGIAALIITFFIYVSGILTPYIPPSRMPEYWGMRAVDYLHAVNAPTGWGWLTMIRYGDYLNLIGVAFLALLTIIGFLILMVAYFRKKDYIYFVISLVEILILSLAASGILAVGGH